MNFVQSRFIIINVDAPELRKFLEKILPVFESTEISALKKQNYLIKFKLKMKIETKFRIVKLKILMYPHLVKVYQKTVMRSPYLHKNVRRIWRRRKAIRFDTIKGQTLFQETFAIREPLIHEIIRIPSSGKRFLRSKKPVLIFVTAQKSKHKLIFPEKGFVNPVYSIDYNSIQKLEVELGKNHLSKEKLFDSSPGFWGFHQDHQSSGKKSHMLLIICDTGPILTEENIDHLFLSEAANVSGFSGITFACINKRNDSLGFVSSEGFTFRYLDADVLDSNPSQVLISTLENISKVLNISENQNLRVFTAANVLGIPYASRHLKSEMDQADLIYEICRLLISSDLIEYATNRNMYFEQSSLSKWKSDVLGFLE